MRQETHGAWSVGLLVSGAPLIARAQRPPEMRRIGYLHPDVGGTPSGFYEAQVESSARRIGLHFLPFTLGHAAELGGAFASMGRDGATGVIFQPIFAVDPQDRASIASHSSTACRRYPA